MMAAIKLPTVKAVKSSANFGALNCTRVVQARRRHHHRQIVNFYQTYMYTYYMERFLPNLARLLHT